MGALRKSPWDTSTFGKQREKKKPRTERTEQRDRERNGKTQDGGNRLFFFNFKILFLLFTE